MFKNDLKISVRGLLRHKAFSLINIFGLAVGVACCLLILLYIQNELSYDRFHEHADRLYQVIQEFKGEDGLTYTSLTGPAMATNLKNDFPEVENAVRLYRQPALVAYGENRFQEERFVFADADFFSMFRFPLAVGDVRQALSVPSAVVITRETAEKYFGDTDPIGKILKYENKFDFKVTGILQDLPANSHLQFDFLASYEGLRTVLGTDLSSWWWPGNWTYVKLAENAEAAQLEKALVDFTKKHRGAQTAAWLTPMLEPVTRIHLHSRTYDTPTPNSDVKYIYTFSIIALFVLLIACINFMNLSTAKSMGRGLEVGIRKVVGARRTQLIRQFLGESFLYSILAFFVAILLIELFLPVYQGLLGKNLQIDFSQNTWLLAGMLALAVVVGLISGSYPAFFLSAFKPVKVLKGNLRAGSGKPRFRGVLVVAQFAISVFLIIGTVVIQKQLHFFRSQSLGFDKEQVLLVALRDMQSSQNAGEMLPKVETFKNTLAGHSGILSLSASSSIPGMGGSFIPYRAEGVEEKPGMALRTIFVDHAWIETMGIEIIQGRDFSKDFTTDATEAFIVNETAAQYFGWQQPLGKSFEQFVREGGRTIYEKQGHVVGVARDFHAMSLHNPIDPVVLCISPSRTGVLLIRLRPGFPGNAVDFIENQWAALFPHRPFEYQFLDERLDSIYRTEERVGKLMAAFSGMAIVIACLGLFGLAAFAAERRTKEIGVRKVLGATVANVVALLSKDFVKLVLLANILAWPVAWWAMNKWLENFAYRIEIAWWVFALAGGLALVIALLTVSTQAIRAAVANPVESLRYE